MTAPITPPTDRAAAPSRPGLARPAASRRVLSLYFPRFLAEWTARARPDLAETAFALTEEEGGALTIAGVSAAAERVGIAPGQSLSDARALFPDLATQPLFPDRAALALAGLGRWAGRFAPWVAVDGRDGLFLDISGTAHLFGGEAAMAERLVADLAGFGYGVRIGGADTPGAAWAVARFGADGWGSSPGAPAGNAIDQEARATRSRAEKRRPRPGLGQRSGSGSGLRSGSGPEDGRVRLIPAGQIRRALSALPLAALRLPAETVAALHRLGLTRVEDVAALPRAALTRRFGRALVRRLDQAFGAEPEPISPAAEERPFAVRLSLPEPIGREADVLAGLDRLLPALAARLAAAGRGARRLRLVALRADGGESAVEVGVARPTHAAERLRPLLALRLGEIEAGFGIDALRLVATVAEPVEAGLGMSPSPQRGASQSPQRGASQQSAAVPPDQPTVEPRALPGPGGEPCSSQAEGEGFAGLLNRLGARLGLEALTRLHPADSHVPEKAFTVMAAAFSDPAEAWPADVPPRPLMLFAPEPVVAEPMSPEPPAKSENAPPPGAFRWRRRAYRVCRRDGPERIAPEWWLDDPAWRSGPRDYWRVETACGARLWLFRAWSNASDMPQGGRDWFVHGRFA